MSYEIRNPILSGFYPDPSICRAGDMFYLACSSFSFFPGIPLFRSRDLANWESIGYALDDPATLKLSPGRLSGGLFAPTLRYYDGKFYIIVGNSSLNETILAVAEDPAGTWEVHTVEGVGGDPSLFWDVDGSCWCSYCSTTYDPITGSADGICHRQLDLETFTLVGEEHFLWSGVTISAYYPEASHMYHKDGWYYLLLSEGGTEHYHAVYVARSRELHGPYVNFRGNPILTHRNLSMYHPICNVGHADFVDTPNGDWYAVVLASRLCGGYHKNLGRETFLCPVTWEGDWPLTAADTGRVEFSYPAPAGLSEFPVAQLPVRDDFDAPTLGWQWNWLGTPNNAPTRLENGTLYIKALADKVIREPEPRYQMPDFSKMTEEELAEMYANIKARLTAATHALGWVGRRQQHFNCIAQTKLRFTPAEGEAAGLMIIQDKYNQLRIELTTVEGKPVLRAVRFAEVAPNANIGDALPWFELREEHGETVLAELPWESDEVVLKLEIQEQSHSFYAGADEAHLFPVALNIDGSFMGSETAGGFVGTCIAMFATANGAESDNEAAFDWFDYCGK